MAQAYPDPIKGFTQGFTGGTTMGLMLRERKEKQDARLAEIESEKQKMSIKQMENNMTIMADKDMPSAIRLKAYNAFAPSWNQFNPGSEMGELTEWPEEGSKFAQRALKIQQNPNYSQDDKLLALRELHLEATALGDKIDLKGVIEPLEKEAEAGRVTQALDIRALQEDPRFTEGLTAEQQQAVGAPSAERGLLLRGGATGAALLKEGAKPEKAGAFAKVDPSKYTPESVRKFEQTGSQGDLIAKKGTGAKYTDEANMRKEFTALSKDYRKVRDSYARIQASVQDPSAAGDLSLIFNYMKMLDPGSVVRESEFATAANSAGVPDRIRKTYNRLLEGERLAPNTREDFADRSDRLFKRQDAQHTQREDTFRTLAENRGFNPANVAINLRDPLAERGEQQAVAPVRDTSEMTEEEARSEISEIKARLEARGQ